MVLGAGDVAWDAEWAGRSPREPREDAGGRDSSTNSGSVDRDRCANDGSMASHEFAWIRRIGVMIASAGGSRWEGWEFSGASCGEFLIADNTWTRDA